MRRPDEVAPIDAAMRPMRVAAGGRLDVCPLCGIYRESAGFLKESCGEENYLKPGCFIVDTEGLS